MKQLFFFFTLMLLPFMAIAQNTPAEATYKPKTFEFKHALGVAGSSMSGLGLSYQYHITPKDRLEATAFMFMDTHEDLINNKYSNSFSVGSFGLEYHHLLAARRNGKLFLMAGAGYTFNDDDDDDDDDYYYSDDYSTKTWLSGAGFVVEIYMPTLNLTFNLDIGITYRNNMNYEDNIHTSTDKYFGIGAGGGIYYTF